MTLRYGDRCNEGEFCKKMDRKCSGSCAYYLAHYYDSYKDDCCYETWNKKEGTGKENIPSWFH